MFGLYSHLYMKLEKWVFSSTFDNFGQKTVNTYGEKSFASSINTCIILTNQIWILKICFYQVFLPYFKKNLPWYIHSHYIKSNLQVTSYHNEFKSKPILTSITIKISHCLKNYIKFENHENTFASHELLWQDLNITMTTRANRGTITSE